MLRPRVLLADDHQAILDRINAHLSAEFQIIATAHDGAEALDASRALKPDIVVLDISMPRMNGLDAAKQIAAMPDPPCIVFLSMHEDPEIIAAAEQVGASGYVLKRNMCTQLAAAMRRALHNHH